MQALHLRPEYSCVQAASVAMLVFILAVNQAAAAEPKQAKSLYKAAQSAELRDDYATAYEDYYEAFEKDPTDLRYETAYKRLTVLAASSADTAHRAHDRHRPGKPAIGGYRYRSEH